MKKAAARAAGWILAALLALTPVFAAADGGSWTCPDCGQAGNTGNYCSNCAAARPSGVWTCPDCGQAGNTGNYCSNCAAPRSAVNGELEQIPGETDRVKIRVKSVEASSYIVNKTNPYRWQPSNAADGDESTCWQFSAKKGLNGKSWIRLNFGAAQTVDEIWFKNGFWAYNDKGNEQYSINARLKGVRVSFLYGGETQFRDEMTLTLKDEAFKDWQRFSAGSRQNVVSVRIAVLSSYKGSHFANDVCLSEAMLVRHAPASSAGAAQTAGPATVYESLPDVTGANLLMQIATRTGPGTEYEEPGTFFRNNWQTQTVKVKGKHRSGNTWWVLVEFTSGNSRYRVWTGLRRVDVDPDKLKEIRALGKLHVDPTEARCGPGTGYARQKDVLFYEDDIEFFGWENGYAEIDYYDVNREVQRRCWVPQSAVSGVIWY